MYKYEQRTPYCRVKVAYSAFLAFSSVSMEIQVQEEQIVSVNSKKREPTNFACASRLSRGAFVVPMLEILVDGKFLSFWVLFHHCY